MSTRILDFAAIIAEASKASAFPQYEADVVQGRATEIAERRAQEAVAREGNRIAEMAQRHPERFSPSVKLLHEAVREWQKRYAATEDHLATSPDSLADHDLRRWNDEHDLLFDALSKAEQVLAAIALGPEAGARVEVDEIIIPLSQDDGKTVGALPSGEDD